MAARFYAVRSFRRGPLWAGLSLWSGHAFAGLSLGRIGNTRLGVVSGIGQRRKPWKSPHSPEEELRRAGKALEAAQRRYDAALRAARGA
jgi:hypothetical protein